MLSSVCPYYPMSKKMCDATTAQALLLSFSSVDLLLDASMFHVASLVCRFVEIFYKPISSFVVLVVL